MQAVPAGELRVRIDVHLLDRGERKALPELLQLRQHFLAKTAVFAVQQRQDGHVSASNGPRISGGVRPAATSRARAGGHHPE